MKGEVGVFMGLILILIVISLIRLSIKIKSRMKINTMNVGKNRWAFQ